MPFRIERLRVKNFKCFDNKKYYKFSFDETLNPIILSGPNGFGKTTFFDAIELIFTKNITRLNNDIEDRRLNLGKNILLNEAGCGGVLVLNLKDQNNDIKTIVTVIDQTNEKLSIGDSIKYCVVDELLNSDEEIESFLLKQREWNACLSDCMDLKYSIEHFNVYYYVSQAESVHFLKKSIKDRKSSVNALLNTDTIDSNIEYIDKDLIGGSKSKNGVIVNDAIRTSETVINEKVNLIKSKLKETNLDLKDTEYEQLLNYDDNTSPFLWDTEDIGFESENATNSLNRIIQEIQSLHYFVINKSDYEKYLENKKIEKLINNIEGIDDFLKYCSFIENGAISTNTIYQASLLNRQKIDIYSHSEFFRKEFDVSVFKREDLIKIKETDNSLISSNIDDISNHVKEIVDRKKELSDNQKLLNELGQARNELHKYINALNDTGTCPFCANPFDSADELEKAFLSLSTRISERKTGDSDKIDKLLQELQLILKEDCQRILAYIKGLDEEGVRTLNRSVIQDQQFVKNVERVKVAEKIHTYIPSNDSLLKLNDNEKPLAVQRYLQEKVTSYANANFESDFKQFDFQDIANKYKTILSIKQDRLSRKENIDKKINYIKQKHFLSESSEIERLKTELKDEIIRKYKLESLRKNLDQLKILYKTSIDAYKNQIIKKLRIPLLIYSGKILQDYQNGLGVFISRDEMRFVSNGDAKHDVLNTFSSGQLSGFVLSFLFAMNKQYITKSNDDLGFILVDDPVQTMDDINIASLIEVLRNDFAEKQIILSTHETDKENYILYKFLKYNLKGQSFNVKEKLYL